jgi:hypothetical protein
MASSWRHEETRVTNDLSALVWVEKAKKVAVIVCTRKLPTTLNTMLTDRARWRTEPPQHT